MSSEIYELMKRPDELAVVAKAHSQPRFVEDCVREMVRRVVEGYPDLPGEAFVMARQENLETIHRHNVVAERYGTLDDLRAELASGEHQRHHTTMREWLEAPSCLSRPMRLKVAYIATFSAHRPRLGGAPRGVGAGRGSSRRR